ncbi:MAG: hydrogenase iron-sulfur subunit [Candidatus Eisenbacteria sp.]|nr:hydrogenase iron-sulfur subunit [Candidatus Eisenbacteria bacterium]
MANRHGGITVFICNWIPAAGADNAGVVEAQYPPSTTIIPIHCTGRLTSGILLEAFRSADAVLVVGCAHDECHYVAGSRRCEDIIDETRDLLPMVGIDAGRLGFVLMSESNGDAFADTVSRFAAQVEKTGEPPAGRAE